MYTRLAQVLCSRGSIQEGEGDFTDEIRDEIRDFTN